MYNKVFAILIIIFSIIIIVSLMILSQKVRMI